MDCDILTSYITAGKICSDPLSDSISNPLSQKQATTTVVSGISNEERVMLTALYGPNKPRKGKRDIFWIHFKPCWKKDDSNLFFGYEVGTLIIWEYTELVSKLSKDSSKTESLKRIGGGRLTAVGLILSVSAVVLPVAAQVQRDTLLPPRALELSGQADVRLWKSQGVLAISEMVIILPIIIVSHKNLRQS